MDTILNNKKKGIAAALFCMFLWGSAFPVLKLSYEELNIPADDFMTKIFCRHSVFSFWDSCIPLFLLFY